MYSGSWYCGIFSKIAEGSLLSIGLSCRYSYCIFISWHGVYANEDVLISPGKNECHIVLSCQFKYISPDLLLLFEIGISKVILNKGWGKLQIWSKVHSQGHIHYICLIAYGIQDGVKYCRRWHIAIGISNLDRHKFTIRSNTSCAFWIICITNCSARYMSTVTSWWWWNIICMRHCIEWFINSSPQFWMVQIKTVIYNSNNDIIITHCLVPGIVDTTLVEVPAFFIVWQCRVICNGRWWLIHRLWQNHKIIKLKFYR